MTPTASNRGYGAEPGHGQLVGGRTAPRVTAHGVEEVVASERPERGVGACTHCRRARDVAKQRDLPDERRRLLELRLTGKVDLERARMKGVEVVARIAPLEQRRA